MNLSKKASPCFKIFIAKKYLHPKKRQKTRDVAPDLLPFIDQKAKPFQAALQHACGGFALFIL